MSKQTDAACAFTPVSGSLFRVAVLHAAPKGLHRSTETYLVAEDEAAVAEWIQHNKCDGYWLDDSEGEEPKTRYDAESNSDIPFRDWVMANRGDLDDEEGWEDAYYGVTKWGWEPVAASHGEIGMLLKLGIAVTANEVAE